MDTQEFIRAQRQNLPILLTQRHVAGKTFVITGSNHGIGREAALHIARLGPSRLILAVRSLPKGQEAKEWIQSAVGDCDSVTINVWYLDTTVWDSVRAFANRAENELDRLDVVVQNAAVAVDVFETNKEGYENTVAGNVFGTVMLAMHLLPKMKETGKKFGSTPHMVLLTSGLAFEHPDAMHLVDGEGGAFAALNREGESPMTPTPKRYSVSNLYKIMIVRELAKVFPYTETGVVINLLSPGLCNTGLARNSTLIFRLQFRIFNALIGRTAEMGSRTILHAMQAGPESHGRYISDCKVKEYCVVDWVQNDIGQRAQERTWKQFLERVEAIEPGLFKRTISALREQTSSLVA
ncbi:hypothetical protein AK830_g10727 [Neonectria ditissima]|uniref:Uncharacterized protein n=1 Tax=Neonectria ditissima TaxID=78410 RepID=A0A0P7AF22_9HYPO|nr:hypothetical protein AK830_g10727 [Neonectria ditissima]